MVFQRYILNSNEQNRAEQSTVKMNRLRPPLTAPPGFANG